MEGTSGKTELRIKGVGGEVEGGEPEGVSYRQNEARLFVDLLAAFAQEHTFSSSDQPIPYFGGGYVRCRDLGLRLHDFDILIIHQSITARDYAQELIQWLEANWLPKRGAGKKIKHNLQKPSKNRPLMTRLSIPPFKFQVEINAISADQLLGDALSRDLTINALYLDVRNGDILDPLGFGREDLQNYILRTIGAPCESVAKNPLHVVRIARFLAELRPQFALEASLRRYLDEDGPDLADEIMSADPIQIRNEFCRLVKISSGRDALLFNRGIQLLSSCCGDLVLRVAAEVFNTMQGDDALRAYILRAAWREFNCQAPITHNYTEVLQSDFGDSDDEAATDCNCEKVT